MGSSAGDPAASQGFTARSGVTNLGVADPSQRMVVETDRDDMTWFECEQCGLMFDSREDARQHETTCDSEEPSYIQ